MMKVAIITNRYEHSQYIGQILKEKLLAHDGIEYDEATPNIVITVGGDGTLLYAFHHYEHRLDQVRFIGVHTGHLGFYTDWRDNEIDDLIEALIHEDGTRISYPLLNVRYKIRGKEAIHKKIALNEVTIRRINHTVVSDIYINRQLFERYRGDGFVISTPTGSTGYNKSLGGAVIPPTLDVFQLTEMAPLNNRVFHTLGSSMILTNRDDVAMIFEEAEDYVLTIDNETYAYHDIEWMKVCVSSQHIHFMRYRHLPFWDRVHQSFLGGKTCD